MLHNIVAANQNDVARVDQSIARTRQSLADAQAHLQALTRPRRFRRSDQQAIDETRHRIQAQSEPVLASRAPAAFGSQRSEPAN